MPSPIWRLLPHAALLTSSLALFAAPTTPARADDTGPIKIGVISEQSAIVGQAILQGAQMAADEINAKGGVNGRKIEIVTYDDHSSAADAVRAFQRAAQPGQGRRRHRQLHQRGRAGDRALVGAPAHAVHHAGAASNDISKHVHDDYDQYKYTFHGWLTSAFIAQSICDARKDTDRRDCT
jgi:branched-chain amino acid transport system substrate-binding protein